MDCRPPGSPVRGILQTRILEWAAMPSSGRFSWHSNGTRISCFADRFFTAEPSGKPIYTHVCVNVYILYISNMYKPKSWTWQWLNHHHHIHIYIYMTYVCVYIYMYIQCIYNFWHTLMLKNKSSFLIKTERLRIKMHEMNIDLFTLYIFFP